MAYSLSCHYEETARLLSRAVDFWQMSPAANLLDHPQRCYYSTIYFIQYLSKGRIYC